MIELYLLPDAEQEMIDSAKFYNERASSLGSDFLNELERSFKLIKENPTRWKFVLENIQKYIMHRFPFNIYYEYFPNEEKIVVISIAHQKRNPNYWKIRKL